MARSSDADDRWAGQLAQVGEVVGNEGFQAVVVESDGIKQPGGRFDGSPRAIASSRLTGDRLGQYRAEAGEIDQVLHLPGIAKGAGSDEDRGRKPNGPELHTQIATGTAGAHEFRPS